MAARIFAVLAAAFLVVSVGIAALLPLGLTLGHGLLMIDSGIVGWLKQHSLDWAWEWLLTPFLQRPLWLMPASIGLIAAGLALTFNLGKPSPSRRRRS
jgi:hypothetical protein